MQAYAILGVAPEISDADLTKAYKVLALKQQAGSKRKKHHRLGFIMFHYSEH